MKKVFFFDIDGTFLSEIDDQIPVSTIKAYEQLISAGHDVFLCTGRNRRDTMKIIEQLKIDSFICSNGQYIEIDNVPYYSRFLSQSEKQEYLSELSDVAWGYMTNDSVKIISNDLGTEKQVFTQPWMEYEYCNETDFLKDDVLTLIIIDNQMDKYPIIAQKNNMYLWNDCNFDVIPKDINKGLGIEKLLEKYEQRPIVYAFGDNNNDIQMFKIADVAISMGNAKENVKTAADFVTKKASEDGIHYALKHLGVIND